MPIIQELVRTCSMTDEPIFWTFRRCPYAMRARLALKSARIRVELREILLKDKPKEFLETSASATVPTLRLNNHVIDESLDIMIWALEQSDPDGLLNMPQHGFDLIAKTDGPFKLALDHTKYASRFPQQDTGAEKAKASDFLMELNSQIDGKHWLFGDRPTLADIAILPFVRQFANIDRNWFDQQNWPDLILWLDHFLASRIFAEIMAKYPLWTIEADPIWFGEQSQITAEAQTRP